MIRYFYRCGGHAQYTVIQYDGSANQPQLGAATMLSHQIPIAEDAPPIAVSDDECVQRLAMLIEHRDNKNLDEIVALIARLTVPLEATAF